jgi:hypothetical protein
MRTWVRPDRRERSGASAASPKGRAHGCARQSCPGRQIPPPRWPRPPSACRERVSAARISRPTRPPPAPPPYTLRERPWRRTRRPRSRDPVLACKPQSRTAMRIDASTCWASLRSAQPTGGPASRHRRRPEAVCPLQGDSSRGSARPRSPGALADGRSRAAPRASTPRPVGLRCAQPNLRRPRGENLRGARSAPVGVGRR